MSKETTKRNFFDLFNNADAILKVKFNIQSDELPTEVHLKNTLGKKTDEDNLSELANLCSDPRLKDFVDFYSNHDGFIFGAPIAPKNVVKTTMLRQVTASEVLKFTGQYLPGKKLAWTMDLNKSNVLYRGEQKWLAFAELEGGPACLTIMLNGENAGNVFLATPQPHFNILKPIAKTYTDLLNRIAKDPAAFFKMLRVYVMLVGADDQNFGHVPLEYIDNN